MKILEEVHNNDSCPSCGESMIGEDIKVVFINKGYTEDEAERTAAMYGWSKENPKTFIKSIGIETSQYDGVTWYRCPECATTWKRFEWSDKKYLEKECM